MTFLTPTAPKSSQLSFSGPYFYSGCFLLAFAALLAIVTLLFPAGLPAQVKAAENPDLVLRGSLSGEDNHAYKLLPFTVPDGVFRITVEFAYTGKEQRTALDLGLFDPQEFRGWSGGNKSLFTVSATDATPSYLPGYMPAGTWKLLVGVPNIRANVHCDYEAKIWFSYSGSVAAEPEVLRKPLKVGAAWYRGDLHSHTAHSDASCQSQSGKKVPCPLMLTVQTAARRGLDFLAITDHNSISHYAEMRELQPYFDQLLLIPGRELTSFTGHANLFGTEAFVDFRVGSKEVPDWNALLERVNKMGGLISVNHPSRVTNEDCMGCGWTANPPADLHLFQAVEAVNSGITSGPASGIDFWRQQLDKGIRLTGIGGGDNHNALAPLPGPGSVGYPTTVVYAPELSTEAILGGIRAGHVFIDTQGTADRLLEVTGQYGSAKAAMGDNLNVPERGSAAFEVHVKNVANGRAEVTSDAGDVPLASPLITQGDQTISFSWTSDGKRHWLQVSVRDAGGKLLLLGNPVYINFP